MVRSSLRGSNPGVKEIERRVEFLEQTERDESTAQTTMNRITRYDFTIQPKVQKKKKRKSTEPVRSRQGHPADILEGRTLTFD